MGIRPYTIKVPQTVLDDLQERLAETRWAAEVEGAGWSYGTNRGYLKSLVDYWQHGYNWRAQEASLNQFAHFQTELDGQSIHFIHERGKGPNPLPIIITHGWPDSFYRMIKIIPLLTDPASYGGDPADSFDVIVPSLPGYGFSERPTFVNGTQTMRAAELWSKLITSLGYGRYAAAGGDFGSRVTRLLALAHPDPLVGIHLTDIGYVGDPAFSPDLSNLSGAAQAYLGATQAWFFQEGAYGMLQGSKPQTLAYELTDSPVGLAAWIVEKFRAWSDCDGDVEKRFTKDELLTNIMIYWVTETISSSIRVYREDGALKSQLPAGQRIEVPTAVALFPRDLPNVDWAKQPVIAPRELAERSLNVQRWTVMPRGGHFAALEEPDLLVEDMRAFFHSLR